MPSVPSIELNNGIHMPAIGLGAGMPVPTPESELARSQSWVLSALKSGYRHIDTAQIYGTEKYVGNAIRESGIPREELFITTKLPWTHHARVSRSFEESLANLRLDYVDLYLIHWPFGMAYEGDNLFPRNQDGSLQMLDTVTFIDVWSEMEKLLQTGKTRAIGVSNFSIKNLEILLKTAKVVPAVNQVELHPYLAQTELVEYCKRRGITLTAYTPTGYQTVLSDPIIADLASKYGVSPAQIVLAWHVARGCAAVPKSTNEKRQKENINLPVLQTEDVSEISSLDKGQRLVICPDEQGLIWGTSLEQLGF